MLLTIHDLEVGTEVLLLVKIGSYYPKFEERIHFVNSIELWDKPKNGFVGKAEIIQLGFRTGRTYFLAESTEFRSADEYTGAWYHAGDPRLS